MLDAAASRGFELGQRSTLLLSGAFSTRVEDGGLRDALLESEARYYLQQSPRALFFATFTGALGHNVDLDNQILLGGDNGLRGYPLRYQSGNASALLTIEQRYFTEWYPFRLFHIGAATFVDIGRTWGDAPFSSPNLGTLRDVGIGLRIGNSRSGLGNVIHVDVAFPLDGDDSISSPQILVETKQRF
jgi:hemolysin activation/secretion protein